MSGDGGERRIASNSSSSWASQRHQARELALQVLFEADFSGKAVDAILERRIAEEPRTPPVASYARELAFGVRERQAEYDETIARLAPTWPLEQMARIDRNILRLAMYEMLHSPQVPMRAAINEAVELAKQFGSEASRRFINGVLGTVAAAHRSASPEDPLDGQDARPEEPRDVADPDGQRPAVAPGEQ